jgi:hypothetical protein
MDSYEGFLDSGELGDGNNFQKEELATLQKK